MAEWVEITDDNSLPPHGVAVWTQSDQNEVDVLVRNDGTLTGWSVYYWERPKGLYLDEGNKIAWMCTELTIVTVVRWRAI